MTSKLKNTSHFALTGMIFGSLVLMALLITAPASARPPAPKCTLWSVKSVQNGCCHALPGSGQEDRNRWDQWYCDLDKYGNKYWRSIGYICGDPCN